MPIFPYSRYRFNLEHEDTDGKSYFDDREPFTYRYEADNRYHSVIEGDTLWGIAHRYFHNFQRPAGLWWVIAEYQPVPIIDPTIALQPGDTIVVPSERVVRNGVFNSENRRFH